MKIFTKNFFFPIYSKIVEKIFIYIFRTILKYANIFLQKNIRVLIKSIDGKLLIYMKIFTKILIYCKIFTKNFMYITVCTKFSQIYEHLKKKNEKYFQNVFRLYLLKLRNLHIFRIKKDKFTYRDQFFQEYVIYNFKSSVQRETRR